MSELVCLVTGGRDFSDEALLFATLDRIHAETPIVRLIHGGCHKRGETAFCGADGLSDKWARAHGVEVEAYPVYDAEWERVGKKAGPIRNGFMALRTLQLSNDLECDRVCVAFPTGGPGTRDCIRQAREARTRVVEVVGNGQKPGRTGEEAVEKES